MSQQLPLTLLPSERARANALNWDVLTANEGVIVNNIIPCDETYEAFAKLKILTPSVIDEIKNIPNRADKNKRIYEFATGLGVSFDSFCGALILSGHAFLADHLRSEAKGTDVILDTAMISEHFSELEQRIPSKRLRDDLYEYLAIKLKEFVTRVGWKEETKDKEQITSIKREKVDEHVRLSNTINAQAKQIKELGDMVEKAIQNAQSSGLEIKELSTYMYEMKNRHQHDLDVQIKFNVANEKSLSRLTGRQKEQEDIVARMFYRMDKYLTEVARRYGFESYIENEKDDEKKDYQVTVFDNAWFACQKVFKRIEYLEEIRSNYMENLEDQHFFLTAAGSPGVPDDRARYVMTNYIRQNQQEISNLRSELTRDKRDLEIFVEVVAQLELEVKSLQKTVQNLRDEVQVKDKRIRKLLTNSVTKDVPQITAEGSVLMMGNIPVMVASVKKPFVGEAVNKRQLIRQQTQPGRVATTTLLPEIVRTDQPTQATSKNMVEESPKKSKITKDDAVHKLNLASQLPPLPGITVSKSQDHDESQQRSKNGSQTGAQSEATSIERPAAPEPVDTVSTTTEIHAMTSDAGIETPDVQIRTSERDGKSNYIEITIPDAQLGTNEKDAKTSDILIKPDAEFGPAATTNNLGITQQDPQFGTTENDAKANDIGITKPDAQIGIYAQSGATEMDTAARDIQLKTPDTLFISDILTSPPSSPISGMSKPDDIPGQDGYKLSERIDILLQNKSDLESNFKRDEKIVDDHSKSFHPLLQQPLVQPSDYASKHRKQNEQADREKRGSRRQSSTGQLAKGTSLRSPDASKRLSSARKSSLMDAGSQVTMTIDEVNKSLGRRVCEVEVTQDGALIVRGFYTINPELLNPDLPTTSYNNDAITGGAIRKIHNAFHRWEIAMIVKMNHPDKPTMEDFFPKVEMTENELECVLATGNVRRTVLKSPSKLVEGGQTGTEKGHHLPLATSPKKLNEGRLFGVNLTQDVKSQNKITDEIPVWTKYGEWAQPRRKQLIIGIDVNTPDNDTVRDRMTIFNVSDVKLLLKKMEKQSLYDHNVADLLTRIIYAVDHEQDTRNISQMFKRCEIFRTIHLTAAEYFKIKQLKTALNCKLASDDVQAPAEFEVDKTDRNSHKLKVDTAIAQVYRHDTRADKLNHNGHRIIKDEFTTVRTLHKYSDNINNNRTFRLPSTIPFCAPTTSIREKFSTSPEVKCNTSAIQKANTSTKEKCNTSAKDKCNTHDQQTSTRNNFKSKYYLSDLLYTKKLSMTPNNKTSAGGRRFFGV